MGEEQDDEDDDDDQDDGEGDEFSGQIFLQQFFEVAKECGFQSVLLVFFQV